MREYRWSLAGASATQCWEVPRMAQGFGGGEHSVQIKCKYSLAYFPVSSFFPLCFACLFLLFGSHTLQVELSVGIRTGS